MSTIRFPCPACNLTLEAEAESSRAGVKCPACGTGFIPAKLAPPPAEIRRRPPVRDTSLTARARLLTLSGASALALAAFLLLAALIGIFEQPAAAGLAIVLLVTAGLALFLFAQLLHLRAK